MEAVKVDREKFFAVVHALHGKPGFRPGHSWMQYCDEQGNVRGQANYIKQSDGSVQRTYVLYVEAK